MPWWAGLLVLDTAKGQHMIRIRNLSHQIAGHDILRNVDLDISKGGLGRVDKRDSHGGSSVIQAGICYGGQFGTRPDDRRGMGVL